MEPRELLIQYYEAILENLSDEDKRKAVFTLFYDGENAYYVLVKVGQDTVNLYKLTADYIAKEIGRLLGGGGGGNDTTAWAGAKK